MLLSFSTERANDCDDSHKDQEKDQAQQFSFFKAHRLLPRRAETYSMRVGAIGPELDGHGTENAELACHLVHSAQGPFLIGVCKLHHQTG